MIPTANVKDVPALKIHNIEVTLSAVLGEILRQDALARSGRFGGTHILPSGPDEARLCVLVEEVGEVAHELNEALSRGSLGEAGKDALVKELVQVAACAVAWATALEPGESR